MTGPSTPELTLVVQNTLVSGVASDILIRGNRIAAIEPHEAERPLPPGVRLVDGTRTTALPGLMNGHSHVAMTLLRGYADDLPLERWLRERIWPIEARLTAEDVYWGSRLGCLEMIRTGTTFLNDMYWHNRAVAQAVYDAGLRGCIAGVLIDLGDPKRLAEQIEDNLRWREEVKGYGGRIQFALGPHALYTVSEAGLRWAAELAHSEGVLVHMHVAETASEVADCLREHGDRPVGYLDRLGLLSDRLLAAHVLHLIDEEIERLAAAGVTVLHNPASGLKLASGGPLRYRDLAQAGVNIVLGTDGAASSNNLDLFEAMKLAALLAKHESGDPTVLPAPEALALATTHAARAFGLASGALAPGRLADLILVDLDHPLLFPGHDLLADLVYSAAGRAVTTTICDGQVLMERGEVADEAVIRREVTERLRLLKG